MWLLYTSRQNSFRTCLWPYLLTYNLLSDVILTCSSFRSGVSKAVVYWLVINGHGINHQVTGVDSQYISYVLLQLSQPIYFCYFSRSAHKKWATFLTGMEVRMGVQVSPLFVHVSLLASAWIFACVKCLPPMHYSLSLSFHCRLPCPIFSSMLRALAQHKILALFLSAAVGS